MQTVFGAVGNRGERVRRAPSAFKLERVDSAHKYAHMRTISILLLSSFLSLWGKEKPAEILAAMPENFADFQRTEVHKYDEPGLGASIAYRKPGLVVTVYAFDRDIDKVKDGMTDPGVTSEIKKAVAEIEAAKQAGYYSKATVVKVANEQTAFGTLQANLLLTRNRPPDEGLAAFSEIHVFGARDHIIKLRISGAEESQKEHRATLDKVLPEICSAIRKKNAAK